MLKTLFLQAPTFDGFDGGAGSRYQAKREIRSFWYPTWLAQPAALVENSRLIDAPPHGTKFGEIASQAKDFDLVVLHTSTPSFASDLKTITALKNVNPKLKAGMIGAKVPSTRRAVSKPLTPWISSHAMNSTSLSGMW